MAELEQEEDREGRFPEQGRVKNGEFLESSSAPAAPGSRRLAGLATGAPSLAESSVIIVVAAVCLQGAMRLRFVLWCDRVGCMYMLMLTVQNITSFNQLLGLSILRF